MSGKTVSQCLIQLLQLHGVKTVFGVPGAYSIDLNDKLESFGIQYCLGSNEGGSAFMAQGYAQVLGGVHKSMGYTVSFFFVFCLTSQKRTNKRTALGV